MHGRHVKFPSEEEIQREQTTWVNIILKYIALKHCVRMRNRPGQCLVAKSRVAVTKLGVSIKLGKLPEATNRLFAFAGTTLLIRCG